MHKKVQIWETAYNTFIVMVQDRAINDFFEYYRTPDHAEAEIVALNYLKFGNMRLLKEYTND